MASKTKVKKNLLDLRSLSKGIPALTKSQGGVFAECAAVCLEDQKHSAESMLCVHSAKPAQYSLRRQNVTDKMRRAHADMQVAAENGAYGVAILVVRAQTGLTAIERARKKTGFDYWLGKPRKQTDLPFQNMARLEVSGILSGASKVGTRVKAKLNQTKQSDPLCIPAYAVVVEFSTPQARVEQR